ncbi:ORF22b [Fowl aviadenovirus E]|uniref:ORF22b n=2 Tax=Fowl aviadenovirus E TaxID=190065 RepID=A0A7G3VXD8_ADEG8|nr:ORF22b [Fowl aviadenovirus E]ABR53722.1 ORF22b [Fowl aviadenovirus 8]ADE58409.1 ORF22b [Fowl aviadenovirus E]
MAAQRLWGEDIGEHQPAAGAGEGDLRFVPAVHAHQFSMFGRIRDDSGAVSLPRI